MTEPSPAPGSDGQPRARGGQPGNRNAVRHGFYARSLPGVSPNPDLRSAKDDLPTEGLPNLSDEIAMLRLADAETVPIAQQTELRQHYDPLIEGQLWEQMLKMQELVGGSSI